jgi:hypothetical protein
VIVRLGRIAADSYRGRLRSLVRRISLFVVHRDISPRHSNSTAFGAKPTWMLTDQNLWVHALRMRRGELRRTWRSWRSFCRSRERHAVVVNRAGPNLTYGSVFPSGAPFCARHWPFAHTPYAAQANGIDEPIPPIRPQIREIVLTRNPNLR